MAAAVPRMVDTLRALGFAAISIGCGGPSFSEAPCGTTADGGPFVLANGTLSAQSIVVDAQNVYWIEGGSVPTLDPTTLIPTLSPPQGRVLQCSKCGCDRPTILASAEPLRPGNGIAVDATSVYWTNGDVMRVPIGGGEARAIAVGNANGPVAVDRTNVYWADSQAQALMKVPIAGGTPTILVSGQNIQTFVLDAVNVYFLAEQGVFKVPLRGGAPTTLAASLNTSAIAVDAENVYWTRQSSPVGESILKVPIAGGAPTALADGIAAPFAIAVDGASVYFAAQNNVMKVARTGGAPVTLVAQPTDSPFAMAVDATSVYWTNSIAEGSPMEGTVLKLTPK